MTTDAAATAEDLRAQVLEFPTDAPEAEGTFAWESTTMVLVHARSGDTAGLGRTYGAPATAQVITGQLRDLVVGRPAFDIPAANEAMSRAVRNTGRPGLVAGAISAVDIALWDLKARLLDMRWFEEPVSSDDLAGLALVRDAVTADVAADEYGYDLPYFARMAPVVDCLQADATRCGGITVWLRAAALAQAHGLDLSGHCAPHVHAHAAASIPNLRHLKWFHDHVRIEYLLFDGALSPDGGILCPGQEGRPGLGLSLCSEVAERFGAPG
ncbi:enolase C-terminal domain-like protein [Kitasatospora sp. NPDC101155]|uniref:enolase C-terminal domain-like protein n=1 Tax=Kitasatospora sp. NPDC101155 TaxID=3364097 RepID=UPI00383005F8